jgi:hypothetical protein
VSQAEDTKAVDIKKVRRRNEYPSAATKHGKGVEQSQGHHERGNVYDKLPSLLPSTPKSILVTVSYHGDLNMTEA